MKNPEIDELEEDDYTIIYWSCKKPIVVEDGWKLVECGNCHRMNHLLKVVEEYADYPREAVATKNTKPQASSCLSNPETPA